MTSTAARTCLCDFNTFRFLFAFASFNLIRSLVFSTMLGIITNSLTTAVRVSISLMLRVIAESFRVSSPACVARCSRFPVKHVP